MDISYVLPPYAPGPGVAGILFFFACSAVMKSFAAWERPPVPNPYEGDDRRWPYDCVPSVHRVPPTVARLAGEDRGEADEGRGVNCCGLAASLGDRGV